MWMAEKQDGEKSTRWIYHEIVNINYFKSLRNVSNEYQLIVMYSIVRYSPNSLSNRKNLSFAKKEAMEEKRK